MLQNKRKKTASFIIITLVLAISLVSVWSILPENQNQLQEVENLKYDNNECMAQGNIMPKPLQKVEEYAPDTPIEADGEEIILASAPGNIKPRPLKPKPDDPSGD